MAHGDINQESYNPMPQEIANRNLCKEIAKMCLDKGLQCHSEITQGVSNPYGSYLTIADLERYRAKINQRP